MGRVICLVMGYVFGLFQTGYLYGKMNHIDIRNYGSGNSGTTNALRVMGKKAGLIVFAGASLLLALCLMKGKVLTIVERRFALVDKTGIVGDQAVLRLTEDLVQHLSLIHI